MPGLFGADDFTEEELRELFADESQQETPPANDKETNSTESQADNKPEEKKEVEAQEKAREIIEEVVEKLLKKHAVKNVKVLLNLLVMSRMMQ